MQMKANTDNKNIQKQRRKKNLVVQLKEKKTLLTRERKRENLIYGRGDKVNKEREKKQRERGAKLSRFYIY